MKNLFIFVTSASFVLGCSEQEKQHKVKANTSYEKPQAAAPEKTKEEKEKKTVEASEKANSGWDEPAKVVEVKKKTAPARKPASIKVPIYIVQIGAFKIQKNAENFYESLQKYNYPIAMKELNHSTQGQLYVVRSYPTKDKSQAESLKEELKKTPKLDANIIVLDESQLN